MPVKVIAERSRELLDLFGLLEHRTAPVATLSVECAGRSTSSAEFSISPGCCFSTSRQSASTFRTGGASGVSLKSFVAHSNDGAADNPLSRGGRQLRSRLVHPQRPDRGIRYTRSFVDQLGKHILEVESAHAERIAARLEPIWAPVFATATLRCSAGRRKTPRNLRDFNRIFCRHWQLESAAAQSQ